MIRLKPEEVLKRYSASQNQKEQWRSIYEDCYKYALPQRNLYEGYYEGKLPGQDKMQNVW